MRIQRECKKGLHGISEHAIYHYDNQKHVRCLECEKEKKKKRYSDPEKRRHDKEVTKRWIENNIIHYKRLSKKYRLDKLLKERELITEFLKKEKQNIIKFIVKVGSSIYWDDIKKHCYHYSVKDIRSVKEFIMSNLKSKMLNDESWKQSSIVKYERGVRDNWKKQPEYVKNDIRIEYKLRAYKIVNEKIKRVLENER